MDEVDFHKIEVMNNGNWEETQFQSLNIGDRFRMIEADGNMFVDSYGEELYATSKPFYDEELGTWLIHIK